MVFGHGILGPDPIPTETRLRQMPLETPKRSPQKFPPNQQPYEFLWLTEGFTKPYPAVPEPQLRFRIFSQIESTHTGTSPAAATLLLRLWRFNYEEMIIDHRPDYRRIVDVYLCEGGEPGGEHMFTEDLEAPKGQSSKANTIYIYELPTFVEPLEKLREIAHEYGHATLPAVGGYTAPEYWANGYLGEKLFLCRLVQEAAEQDWMMGAKAGDLKQWIEKECKPLWTAAAQAYPTVALKGTDEAAMNRYIGLMLWMQIVLPPKLVGRSMKFQSSSDATTVPKNVVEAIEGAGPFTFVVPDSLKKKAIWLPFGNFTLTGGKVLSKKSGWVQVQPVADKITASQVF
jgi:hypothetical protein